ncbi:MAG: TIGR00730 family Rossman fold protein [Rhodospirillales bacterium]|nr:TIGR00730 family Rossman fold protein [Rhodospirillales bacterium]
MSENSGTKNNNDNNNHNHEGPSKAYLNRGFLKSRNARTLRILSEYLEPDARFEDLDISDTIVFFGSARVLPRDVATHALEAARAHGGDVASAEQQLTMSRYYEDCRELAHRLTEWSKGLEKTRRRFVVCTGGGPGIMEAANRGASEAKGLNIGLNIALPHEQQGNPYITRELEFEFNYFFMRKYWFIYLAKALIAFPGGFGTLDEFFELMTLMQTGKLKKKIPIILYGTSYWEEVINFDALVKFGAIEAEDLDLFYRTDSVDEAYAFITRELEEKFLAKPGGAL